MSTIDDDNVVSNYLNEIYNKCNKIISDHNSKDDINGLFDNLDSYAISEFEKYNSIFSGNIETIFKTFLTSNLSFLDEDTRKQLHNLIHRNANDISKFISFLNIKEIPNPNSDLLIRLFNYEIKDNFNRFYLHNYLLAVIDKLTLVCVNRKSSILNGILLWGLFEIKDIVVLEIKKKEINFFKNYFLQDLKLIYEKTYSKILKDTKNKDKYNLILKKYIGNNMKIYEYYNRSVTKLLMIAFDTYYLAYNTLQFYDTNPAKPIIPIFLVIVFLYSEYINSRITLNSNKDVFFKTKEQLSIYLDDIVKNFNIISESNTFSKEFDNLSIKTTEILETMYKEDIDICTWLRKTNNNSHTLGYTLKYIMFAFINYNPGLSFELDFIKSEIFVFTDRFTDLSTYYSDNVETEKILNSIIEDIERNDLFINDSEILFTIEDLSHSFGKNIIFENVSLIIPKNNWICFYGNSGSGKTTLCNILLQQVEPDIGIIKYMGKYSDYKYTDICKDISYVTASPEVFDNTIMYNIVYGINNSEDKEIQDKMNYYVKLFGLDKCDLNHNVSTLSTGQKQRVSIIRLILQDRQIMILDEITSNIDNEMEKIILEEIRKIQKEKNKTVIHITHNLENKVFSDINLYILNKDIIRVK